MHCFMEWGLLILKYELPCFPSGRSVSVPMSRKASEGLELTLQVASDGVVEVESDTKFG